jgi:16S rRNA (uracil1498-N3)-methyltransferase
MTTTPRLFIEPAWIAGDGRRVKLPRDQARYLRSVLRLAPGAPVALFDGTGLEYAAELRTLDGSGATAEILTTANAVARGNGITLAAALTKGAKLDLVVQKATELGAGAIAPVVTRRAVPRVEDAGDARVARWRRIAVEAAEQCGRGDVPTIRPVEPLERFLARDHGDALRLCFHEGAARGEDRVLPLRELVRQGLAPGRAVIALLGPEGGFDPEEAEAAQAAGFTWVGLGPRILRAETAALAALCVLAYEMER